ncbi:MAG: hypothetical protein K6T83_21115 [Alicyclobacillus sp.]|nr:hypothetical protein [Alicyclobacillus sp.]
MLVVLATRAGRANFDPRFVWFATFGLPFLCFGLGIGWTVNEWRSGTAGWWLTLPVSRGRLVASKYAATLLRTLVIYARVFLGISIFGLYTLAAGGHLTAKSEASFLGTGIGAYTLLLAVSPLPVAFGVFYGILTQSRLKPAIPLVWLAVGLMWWLLSTRGISVRSANAAHPDSLINVWTLWSESLVWSIAGMWLLSCVLLYVATILLDRYLAL